MKLLQRKRSKKKLFVEIVEFLMLTDCFFAALVTFGEEKENKVLKYQFNLALFLSSNAHAQSSQVSSSNMDQVRATTCKIPGAKQKCRKEANITAAASILSCRRTR
jgi:hypothetical protein